MINAINPDIASRQAPRLRRWSVMWVGFGGFVILVWSFVYNLRERSGRAAGINRNSDARESFYRSSRLAVSFACSTCGSTGAICRDRFACPWPLALLNVIAGIIFLALAVQSLLGL
jgi:hypothetical protein